MNAIFTEKKNSPLIFVLVGLFLLTLILTFKVVFGKNGYINYQQEQVALQILVEQNDKRVSENARIATIVADLKSNSQASTFSDIIEEKARTKYNLIRNNEVVYKFVEK